MRVFVTGATGFIGSAIVQDLIGAGHQVLGLARSAAAAQALSRAGASAHHGALDDAGSLARGVAAADGVIHTAFDHDFSRFAANCAQDARAIAALGAALVGSQRPLIVTSGTALLAGGRLASEGDAPSVALPRVASEQAAAALASQGVRVAVVRLPPTVHGEGDHGFVPLLIGIARSTGVSVYVGDGSNRWPAVHRLDAARLFRLACERGSSGACYHGVAEEGIPFSAIAAVIARRLGVAAVGKAATEAAAHFGWFAHFAALDNPTASQRTQNELGWQPSKPGLISDLDHARYFAG